ncbi:MAG: substrate-binding domain-containing protein [Candidatus Omnitrophica bacterium]|nr:substrate-binding domain-containing protein [Candidatus Omnitrophota bacterium]
MGCSGRAAFAEERITLSGAWALYPMAVKWAEEYTKINPGVKIDVSAGGAGKGMADCLAGIVEIGMVSRDITKEEEGKGAYAVAVTKDAVVATVNSGNPAIKEIAEKGLTKEAFAQIFIDGNIATWGDALGTGDKNTINVYTRSDSCGAGESWAKYLGKKQEDIAGLGVYGDPGVAQAVKSDVLGIGYNNINFVYDNSTKKPLAGIQIVSIDINGNRVIDAEESFYGDRDSLTAAIAGGKYPSPPARELFFVTKGKSSNTTVEGFINWVLTEGQKYVEETGYVKLPKEMIESELFDLGE